jgi:flagellar biosynthesis protein FlhG|uniref:CobQ/CobB/MinD/ParA nucleotide binding domain-containing protein n=1 Tax=Desulfobacca acetoxidans TaxID=60893 RepID=A0A7C3WRN6_9BACT
MNKKIWAVGGGKGGIGKSVFTLGLAISLARLGRKLILVDADLGGANLHTLMGVRYPPYTLEDFLLKRVGRLEDIIIDTQVEGIGLICGADDILGAANPTHAQKMRLLHQMADLPADLVLVDLGAGTSFNVLDFFNYSPGKICLLTNQATSLQNVYGFIKSSLYRHLSREFARNYQVLDWLMQSDLKKGDEAESLNEFLLQLNETEPESCQRLVHLLREFQVFLVVNMVKSDRDFQAALIIEKVCNSFLSLKPRVLGQLSYDPAVEGAVNQLIPFPLRHEKSQAARDLERIAFTFLESPHPSPGQAANHKLPGKETGFWSRFWHRAEA